MQHHSIGFPLFFMTEESLALDFRFISCFCRKKNLPNATWMWTGNKYGIQPWGNKTKKWTKLFIYKKKVKRQTSGMRAAAGFLTLWQREWTETTVDIYFSWPPGGRLDRWWGGYFTIVSQKWTLFFAPFLVSTTSWGKSVAFELLNVCWLIE